MQKSKLIRLFQSLDKQELKVFKQFLHAPLHNKHTEVAQLGDYLIKNQAHLDGRKGNKELVFKRLFPKTPYNDLRLRHIMSNLLKVVEAFLAYQEFKTQEHTEEVHLLHALQKRGLSKPFQAHWKKTQHKQQQQHGQKQDVDFFFHQFLLEKAQSNYLEAQQQRNIEPNLQNLSDSLDYFYLLQKLKTCCGMLNYQNLVNFDYDLTLLDKLLQHLENTWQTYPSIIAFYYHAILSLRTPTEIYHFEMLKNILAKNAAHFPDEERKDMYTLARNYCIKRFNGGESTFLQTLLKLYELELSQMKLQTGNYLSPLMYKNIIAVGLIAKNYDWVEQFIYDYTPWLSPDISENALNYNLARLRFEQEDYEKVITLLHQVSYDELFTGLDSRTLLLKTYYELGEESALLALLDSFRVFLRRKEQIAYHRNNYLNLIKFVQQLLRLENQLTPHQSTKQKAQTLHKTQQLQTTIHHTKELIDKAWLLKKVDLTINRRFA